MAATGGCIAHCPAHATTWNTGTISANTIITYYHFQEIMDAIQIERNRRYNTSSGNFAYTENISAGNIITNNTISKFKNYIDELRSYNPNISVDQSFAPNSSFTWNYTNYYNTSNYLLKVDNQEILANSMLELRTKINDLNNDCICNCNYCTCNCNYACTCNCNYACTCNCNYACTCNCNYACTCNCNYACTCNCNYCTCNCNYCTCDCNYACTCNCNYTAPPGCVDSGGC